MSNTNRNEIENDGTLNNSLPHSEAHKSNSDEPTKIKAFDIQMPVEVRNVSLIALAIFATIGLLYWAQSVFIPIVLGIIISYALSPIVDTMEKWKIHRGIGAGLILTILIGSISAVGYSLKDEATKLISALPEAAQNLRRLVKNEMAAQRQGPIDNVQKAAARLEALARDTSFGAPVTSRGVTKVQIEKPGLNIVDYLWTGTMGLLVSLGEIVIVVFLVYFLLASGNTFRRKFVRLSGPTLSKRKITIHVLDEINRQIQRFLGIQVFTSALVGIVTWIAFLLIGVENAAIWGIAAGVFNCVPYIGPVIVTAGTALISFLQFGTLSMSLFVSGVALAITSLEGFLLTPWLTGQACKMNPVVVFIAVLFWGWLWGPWGLLLGVPITMVIKVICDHVEEFSSIGELLSDDAPKHSKNHNGIAQNSLVKAS